MHIASCQPPNWRRIDSRRFGTAHIVYLLVLYMFVIAVMPARAKPIQTAVGDAMTRGMNAFRRGDMEQAAILWQQAARDYAAAHQLQAQSVALTHLARAYTALGHSDRARQSLYTALHSAKAAGDVRQTALVFANLGQLAIARQDFEDAEAQLHSALTQASDLRDGQLMATILHHQGNLFWRQRRPRDALTAYRESASMAEQKAQFGMAARALAHAARVAAQAQQPDTAATWLDDARRYLKREAASHETVYDLLLIGRLYQQLATANRELMPKAFSAFQDAQILAHDLQDQRALAYAWGYLGHLYEVEHRYADALVLTRRAVLAAQQTSTPESLYQWEWQTGRLLRTLGRDTEAMATYARALETVQSIQSMLRQGHSGPNASFRHVIGPLYFQYVDLLLQKAKTLETPEMRMVYPAYEYYLQQTQMAIEQFKTSELRDYFGDACVDAARPRTTSLDRVARDAGIIYPILLEDRTELLMTLPTGMRRVAIAAPGAQLERLTRAFRNALQAQDPQRYLRHAKRLYELLIDPIEADLKAAVRTLVWVPDGVLRLLPFAALHNGEQFLVERYALAITPSLALTDPRPLPQAMASVLAAGMTEAVADFPPLPHVRNEPRASINSMAALSC